MDRLDWLIAEGERLEASMGMEIDPWWASVTEVEFSAFAVSAVECVGQLAGEQSDCLRVLRLHQQHGGLTEPGFERVAIRLLLVALKALRAEFEPANC